MYHKSIMGMIEIIPRMTLTDCLNKRITLSKSYETLFYTVSVY